MLGRSDERPEMPASKLVAPRWPYFRACAAPKSPLDTPINCLFQHAISYSAPMSLMLSAIEACESINPFLLPHHTRRTHR